MDVYFIRHGQTDGNIARRHQHPDTPLNESGKQQVEAIAAEIVGLQPTHAITSTQLRAVETARIITTACGIIPDTHPDFEELRHPRWLMGARYMGPTTVLYMLQWFFGLPISGGESYDEFLARIKRAQNHLETLPPEARVIVVSHSVFMNIFIEHLCLDNKMSFLHACTRFIQILRLRNAGVIHLRYTPGAALCGWTVVRR